MKRHLVLITHFYSTHNGGIEKVAVELASRLATDHSWTTTWMASDTARPPSNFPCELKTMPAYAWNGIERRLGFPWPIWSLGALRQLWNAIGRADVVHLHDAVYFGNAFAWMFARLRRVPIVVTQHIGEVPFRSRALRTLQALANRTLGRIVLSTADQVVFISPAVEAEFARFCTFRVPPVYFPNGVDISVFRPEGPLPDDPTIAEAIDSGKPVMLFVGRFVEKKGLHLLHQLAAAFPEHLWVLAGHGPLDPASWGLANVIVVRDQSGPGLARYYRAANILLLPSVGEGFPLVVQEAMACGTPVLIGEETADGCPAARDLMLTEAVGAADSCDRWVHHLAQVLERPGELAALRPLVAEFAKEHWSWTVAAARYAAMFESLCPDTKSNARS